MEIFPIFNKVAIKIRIHFPRRKMYSLFKGKKIVILP